MGKVYNLSKLFQEDEFDVQKGWNRCGSKEAYFSVLSEFTTASESLLEKCKKEQHLNGVSASKACTDKLQGMLANIGAVKLTWEIERLNGLLDHNNYNEYASKLFEVLTDVDRLRRRIISAEKRSDEDKPFIQKRESDSENCNALDSAPKHRIKPRRDVFEKLLMLIDNFEFSSALERLDSIMQYRYTAEMDPILVNVHKSLEEFNYDKSLEYARKLFALALVAEEAGKQLKKVILAIDDMPDVLRTIKAMLKEQYSVFGVTNYEEAIKFLRSNTVDLILLDIEMPGIDGFAMMQMFRKLPECAEIPIVILTGNVTDAHIRTASNLGVREFIKKPVDLAVLLNKLESAFSVC